MGLAWPCHEEDGLMKQGILQKGPPLPRGSHPIGHVLLWMRRFPIGRMAVAAQTARLNHSSKQLAVVFPGPLLLRHCDQPL